MALSTREVLMIIRARDLASRELAHIGAAFTTLDNQAQAAARSHIAQGQALMGIGAAMGVAGGAAIAFYVNSAKAAMEYNRESALTLTQVDQLGVSLNDVAEVGKRVARDVAAPFKEMQSSLYDIFSSMEVSVKEAEQLLNAHARAAVAGQTSIQVAGRATIAIMNAFKIPVEEVNRVLDVQFQTVRKGVITYEQLATTIGRAIPSAVKAGASIEELGAALAFATRMGLSAAMSATSVARAYDLLSNPKFGAAMRDFGVEVTDATGKFRPMLAVVTDLRKRFIELGYTEEEIAAKLQQLTKGAGGTIQAMRFLNLAVQDSSGLFEELSRDLENAGGSFEEAYRIMSNTPAAKIQELKNSWEILRIEIGDRVLPVFGALAVAAKKVIDWFLDLDDQTKDVIVRIGLLTAAIVTLTGVLTFIGGMVLVLRGSFALLGAAIVPLLATVTGFAALSAAIVYLATQTEVLTKATELLKQAWEVVVDVGRELFRRVNELIDIFGEKGLSGVIKQVVKYWNEDFETIHGIVHDFVIEVVGTVRNATPKIIAALREWSVALGSWIYNVVPPVLDALGDYTKTVVSWLMGGGLAELARTMVHWGGHLWRWIVEATGPTVEKLGEWLGAIVNWIQNRGLPILVGGVQFFAKAMVGWIKESGPEAIGAMLTFISEVRDWILTKGVTLLVGAIEFWRETLYPWIMDAIPLAIGALGVFVRALVQFLEPAVNVLFGVMQKYAPVLWEWIQEAVPKVLDALKFLGQELMDGFREILSRVGDYLEQNGMAMFEKLLQWEDALFDWVGPLTDELVRGFGDVLSRVISWLGENSGQIVTGLLMIGQRMMDYLYNDLLPAAADATAKIGISMAEAFVRGLVGIPVAVGQYFDKPLRDAIQQQSEFENEVKVSWDSIKQMMADTAPRAAETLEILRAGGYDVATAFKDIAMTAPTTAKAIMDALRASGADVKVYEDALKELMKVQGETGENARQAFQTAEDASRAYGNQIDRLLLSVTSVKDASANFELALHSLYKQIETNKTSTESAEVQQARLQLAFSRTIKEVGDYIKEIQKQGLSTDEAKEAVGRHLTQLEEMRTKMPGQTEAIDPLIQKIKDLTKTTNTSRDDGLKAWQEFRDGSRTTFEGIQTELVTISNAMHAELTRLHRETGNDSYRFMMDALRQLPDSTGEVSQKTYDAVVNVLQHMPGYTGGAGKDSVEAWLRHLGEGTGGTDATTAGWARAMLAILNPLLEGVGAPSVKLVAGGPNVGTNGMGYAQGGIVENHTAQIAQAGAWRVWAEPETGGEAYIPLAQSKRARSIEILKDVADRFGIYVAEHAEGAIWPPIPDFSAYGTMIGDRGGYDSVKHTRDIVVAWDQERVRKLNEAEAAARASGGGASVNGLTAAAQAMVNAVLSRFPDQTMTSGYRSPEENARVGGAPNSDHMYGRAADFAPGSNAVASFLNNYPNIKQVLWQVAGHYDHVHGAVYDKGGLLDKGVNLVKNNTRMPEGVLNWEQLKAVEWLMGHAPAAVEQVAQAAGGPVGDLQAAARAVSQAVPGFGGIPGYAPSLGMMLDTAQHTAGLLGTVHAPSAASAMGGSLAAGITANALSSPGGLGGSSNANVSGPMFSEGAIQMQITGSNPEEIATQVEAKLRSLIAELRMR